MAVASRNSAPSVTRSNGSLSSLPAKAKDSIDPDTDTITHYEYRTEKGAALQHAQVLFDTTDDLAWGVVTVRKQVVDWFYEEDGIAGWEETDEEFDIM